MENKLFSEVWTSLKCLDLLTFNQPLNIWWISPAAGFKPLVCLSFINHILLLLAFTGPMYLFPLPPHMPITVKTKRKGKKGRKKKSPQEHRQQMCTDIFKNMPRP